MQGWEIVERRYHTIPMVRPEFKIISNMKTVVLMIRLPVSIWSTGKAVILDNDLCVLKGLLENRKR